MRVGGSEAFGFFRKGDFYGGGLGGEVPHITFVGGGRDTMKAREAQSMGFKARLCEDAAISMPPFMLKATFIKYCQAPFAVIYTTISA